MKLSVCIVNYYSEELLKRFLESFMDYRPDCLHEVIVVDNGSDTEHLQKELKEEFGDWVHVIKPQKNLGFGSGHNRAAKKAKGEYLLLCNPDLEIDDASVERLLHFAEKQKKPGIVGPRLVHSQGEVQNSCRRFPRFSDLVIKRLGLGSLFSKRMKHYLMEDVDLEQEQEVDWLVGAAMLMKRDLFEELKGFDERFFLFFGDTDLCRRAKEAGHPVRYYPEATLVHSDERLSERGFWPFKKVFWIHLASAGKYFAKWGNRSEASNSKSQIPNSKA